jgi:hypothetical protein
VLVNIILISTAIYVNVPFKVAWQGSLMTNMWLQTPNNSHAYGLGHGKATTAALQTLPLKAVSNHNIIFLLAK